MISETEFGSSLNNVLGSEKTSGGVESSKLLPIRWTAGRYVTTAVTAVKRPRSEIESEVGIDSGPLP